MKILQISYRLPYPPTDGGTIGILNLAKAYSGLGHQVTMLAFNTIKHSVKPEELPQSFLPNTKLEWVALDNRVKWLPALLNLFTDKSYHVERFISKNFDQQLTAILQAETFDLVHLDGIFMCPYIHTVRQYSKAKIVLRAHNVEYKIWQRLAQNASGLRKWYLQLLAKRLRTYEVEQYNRVDVVAAITPEDKKSILADGCTKPIYVLPAGVNMEDYELGESEHEGQLFHIGAMDWQPNVEGIMWFLDECWPLIKQANKAASLHLAGRNMPDWLLHQNREGVKVYGEVPDAKAFIRNQGIMLVPLLSGGGMRIKIIEGMALGKCIISTSIGAEGIGCTPDQHIIIADTPEQWQQAVTDCYKNPDNCKKIGQAARTFIEQNFDNLQLMRNFLEQINLN